MSAQNESKSNKGLGFTPRSTSRTELSKIAAQVSDALLRRRTSSNTTVLRRAKGSSAGSTHEAPSSENEVRSVSGLGHPLRASRPFSNASLSVPRSPPTEMDKKIHSQASSGENSLRSRSPDGNYSESQTHRTVDAKVQRSSSSIPIPAQRSSLSVYKPQKTHSRFSSSQSSDHTVESCEVNRAETSTPPTYSMSMSSRHPTQPVRSGVQKRPCSFSSLSSSVTSINSEPLEEDLDHDSRSASITSRPSFSQPAKEPSTRDSSFNSKSGDESSAKAFLSQTGAVMNAIEGMLEKLLDRVESVERRVEQLTLRENAPKTKTDEKKLSRAYSNELMNEWVEKVVAAELSLANLENRVASGLSNGGIGKETPAIGHQVSGISNESREVANGESRIVKEGYKELENEEENDIAAVDVHEDYGVNTTRYITPLDHSDEIAGGYGERRNDTVIQSMEPCDVAAEIKEPQESNTLQSGLPSDDSAANPTLALLGAMAVLPLRVADFVWDSAVIGCAETVLLPVRAVRAGRVVVRAGIGAVHGMWQRRLERLVAN
ncbi:hypothetical protein BJ742DRAFT_857570 [Cladochytrium replicatum]|nr:hypothetical protein BJ742DRAFT_857570 [Cladochytrium replicatum]